MNQSSKQDSFNTGKKLKIKLSNASVNKRVKDTPENFEALKVAVREIICKDELARTLLEKNLMEISYKNEQGNFVAITNDEELQAAYEVAGTQMKGHLDIAVKPRLMVTTKDGETFEIYNSENP